MSAYSSGALVVTFGNLVLEGFAEDDGITANRTEDRTTSIVGQDSGVSHSKNPNKTGQCVMLFRQNARANSALAGIAAEEDLDDILIIADIRISDPSGTVYFEMLDCHISASPEWVYGSSTEGKNRSWTFFVENFRFTPNAVGSLTETSALIVAEINAMLSFAI